VADVNGGRQHFGVDRGQMTSEVRQDRGRPGRDRPGGREEAGDGLGTGTAARRVISCFRVADWLCGRPWTVSLLILDDFILRPVPLAEGGTVRPRGGKVRAASRGADLELAWGRVGDAFAHRVLGTATVDRLRHGALLHCAGWEELPGPSNAAVQAKGKGAADTTETAKARSWPDPRLGGWRRIRPSADMRCNPGPVWVEGSPRSARGKRRSDKNGFPCYVAQKWSHGDTVV
jgi:hypothetical protein